MLGALCHYVTHADLKDFQPMKANFGILPSLETKIAKRERGKAYSARGLAELQIVLEGLGVTKIRHWASPYLRPWIIFVHGSFVSTPKTHPV